MDDGPTDDHETRGAEEIALALLHPDTHERLQELIAPLVERGEDEVRRAIGCLRELRALGVITPAQAFFLIANVTEQAMLARVEEDPVFLRIEGRLRAIEREHGLREDEWWRIGEGPPEWDALNEEWERHFDQQWSELLRSCGEPTMAELRATNAAAFSRGVDHGMDAWWDEPDEAVELEGREDDDDDEDDEDDDD